MSSLIGTTPARRAICWAAVVLRMRVALQQIGAAPTLNQGGKLPGQIGDVINAGVHAKAALGGEKMNGISRHDGAAAAIGIGNQALTGGPRKTTEIFEFGVYTDAKLEPPIDDVSLLLVITQQKAGGKQKQFLAAERNKV